MSPFLQNMTGFITQQFQKNISSQDYWVEGLTAQNIYLYKNRGGTKTKKVWISQAAQVTTFCTRNLLLVLIFQLCNSSVLERADY